MGEYIEDINLYIIDESETTKELAIIKGIDTANIENALEQLKQSAELTIEGTKELARQMAKLTRTKKEEQDIKQYNKNTFRSFIRRH